MQIDLKAIRRKKADLSAGVSSDLTPPQSPEAEQAILGCILLEASCVSECQTKLTPEAFYDLRHRAIYDTMLALYDKSRIVDMLALIEALRRGKQLEAVGGVVYLTGLPDTVPSAANLAHYLDIVLDKHCVRKMIEACTEAVAKLYEAENASEVMEEIEQDLLKVGSMRGQAGEVGIMTAMHEHEARLEAGWKSGGHGMLTGFKDLDEMLGGMDKGEVIVVGAAPSVGKTALALNILSYQLRLGVPCAFFSLEMGAEQIAARLASEESGIPLKRARKGLVQEDFDAYSSASQRVSKWPLKICDDSSLSVGQIRGRARRLKALRGTQLIAVDYVQLVQPGIKTGNRTEAVAHVSREFKAMARELQVPVILLAQLSRDHKKFNRKPGLHDLRESGAIEADADKIFLLDPSKVPGDDGKVLTEVLLRKNRNEATGHVELLFNQPVFRFENMPEV